MLPNFRSGIEMVTFATMVDTNTSSPSTDKNTQDKSNHGNAPSPIQTANNPNSSLNNWEITPADPPNTTQHLNTGSSQKNAYNNPMRGLHLLYKAAMLHDQGSDNAQGSSDTNKVKAQKIVRKTKPAKKAKRLPLNSPVSNPNKKTKETKAYVCEFVIDTVKHQICGKTYTSKYALNVHSRIHTGEKPYKCNICDKSFARSDILLNHQRIHTGEKYICDICGQKITDRSYFKQHMRTHTGEKPYKCNICDKSFARSDTLLNHQRIHTGEKYICDICGQGITDRSYFKQHMRCHTGEKPFACNLCGKIYTRKAPLIKHTCSQQPIPVKSVHTQLLPKSDTR